MSIVTVKTKHPKLNAHVITMQDGANVGLIVADDSAIAVDLPMQAWELSDWRTHIAQLTDKPLRWIIFTSPERVSTDTLKLLAPVDKPAPKVLVVPTIIHDAGFNQLYAALEAAQPRTAEPLPPFELRKRGILPETTFSEHMSLVIGSESFHVDLWHVGGCMPGGIFVSIRDTGVIFTGDHIATDDPPVLYANSDLDKWIDALNGVQHEKTPHTIVPGRGQVGEMEIVTKTLEFLRNARSGLRKLARAGRSRDAVAGLVPGLMATYHKRNGGPAPTSYMFSIAGQSLQLGLEQLYDQLIRKPIAETE